MLYSIVYTVYKEDVVDVVGAVLYKEDVVDVAGAVHIRRMLWMLWM